jgi:molecular chaperone DnaJ
VKPDKETRDCVHVIAINRHPLQQVYFLEPRLSKNPCDPQAVLGADIEVPTMDGPEKLSIPAGTQPGRMFELRGSGGRDAQAAAKGVLGLVE